MRFKKILAGPVVGATLLLIAACGGKENTNENLYGMAIANLADDELFAIIGTNAKNPVLLATNLTYSDEVNEVAISCDVYYSTGDGAKNIGHLESFGTAYPIAYDATGIYSGGGHELEQYVIADQTGTLELVWGVYVTYDENGDAAYTRVTDGVTESISEEEYLAAWEKYENSTVVNFKYGARV